MMKITMKELIFYPCTNTPTSILNAQIDAWSMAKIVGAGSRYKCNFRFINDGKRKGYVAEQIIVE